VLVRDQRNEPGFWLVPLLCNDSVSGFVILTLSGTVQRVGTFGSGTLDRASWFPASYFIQPPAELIRQIMADYPQAKLSEAVFSFDRVPERWGWRVQIDPPDGDIVFIGAHGWYAVPSGISEN